MSKLNKDILFLISEELGQDDSKSLFSCLMVNRLWCETVIPILWRNPWCYDINYSNKNYLFKIIASYLSDDIKEFLTGQGIQLPLVSFQSLLFDYLSFCRSININIINMIITSIGSSLTYNQFLLQQEFYGLFMKKFPELKYLNMKSIRHQIFYFPEARIRLESLCELKCDTSTDSSYFYGLVQLCQYIQRLIVVNSDPNDYHGIAELIRVQKNLNRTLQKVVPKFHKLKTLKTSFSNFTEEQLKKCVYHDLEVFKIDHHNLKAASIIIENSGGHLKRISLEPYGLLGYIDGFVENSLIFIRNIHKNCPLIEYLSLIFSPSNEHFAEIEKLLKICQNLKSLLLIIVDYTYEDSTYEQKILEYGEILLKILISSTLNNIKEIRFCGDFKFSLQALEEFLKKWKGNALSIIMSNYIYEDDDYYEELINKYKNNGVIKDFRSDSHRNTVIMDE
ncbi:hypothetical protein RhiirC2_846201 [Rhizophagus irregularis]|uniref:F-box domain-containing protein n=1 Tax=Rhizophagus irregularis TaxID=588596 RepID=A0A2N1NMV7_9GLOM|nr:hypothetical protein RhiirC2_846201 [Rhizophagus irregularis]